MSVRCLLTTVTCLLAATLLLAILICSLTPSPNMREMWWIPDWLGTWADRNGNLRNFPVFAAFSAVLFLVFNTCHAGVPRRSGTKAGAAPRVGGFVFNFFKLNTANCHLPTSKQSSSLFVSRLLVLRRAALCFCAAALLGASLEVAQLLFLPNRHFDWADIGWSTSGAFVGPFACAFCVALTLRSP